MNSEEKKEAKRQRDLKALIDGKLDSYGVTKRTIYSIMGIFGCLILTVVMSITGAGFDPSVFFTWNYWTSMIVQFAISIFSMITGRQIGDDTQKNKPNGQFRKELSTYSAQYNRIDTSGYFDYFETWIEIYRENKLQDKIKKTLRKFGIKQDEVLDLDLCDIPNLNKPWAKDWTGTPFYDKYYDKEKNESKTIFKSLSETQIKALESILNGGVRVSEVSASYFMTALKGTSVDEWERAASADKKKGARLASGYTYRIFSMLAISLIVNGLIPSPYEDASSVALNIATRIFVLITSVIWGIYLGFKIVDMDIVFLSYKCYILKKYGDEAESGAFKPETIKEEAEREYAEYQLNQEKAKENVVEPEVMSPPMLTGGTDNG